MTWTWNAASPFKQLPAVRRSAIFILLASRLQAQSPLPGQSPLQGKPHLFGTGVTSTQDAEANASFTPDGNTVYFSKHNPGWGHITIVVSHRNGGHWTSPRWLLSPASGKIMIRVSHPMERSFSSLPIGPPMAATLRRKIMTFGMSNAPLPAAGGEPKHIGSPVNSDGNESVKQALGRGHLVTAFVRWPEGLKGFGDHINVRQGDLLNSASLQEVIQGHDADLVRGRRGQR
jgi:NAD(P)H-binding